MIKPGGRQKLQENCQKLMRRNLTIQSWSSPGSLIFILMMKTSTILGTHLGMQGARARQATTMTKKLVNIISMIILVSLLHMRIMEVHTWTTVGLVTSTVVGMISSTVGLMVLPLITLHKGITCMSHETQLSNLLPACTLTLLVGRLPSNHDLVGRLPFNHPPLVIRAQSSLQPVVRARSSPISLPVMRTQSNLQLGVARVQ